jgi:L-serine/L-threonine ammonia-lyase
MAEGKTIVFIVCGGVKISATELEEYRNIIRENDDQNWEVMCDGEKLFVAK